MEHTDRKKKQDGSKGLVVYNHDVVGRNGWGGIENPIHVISFLSVRRLKCVEKYILKDNKAASVGCG